MMKILAVGDMHGNYQKIIHYLQRNKVDLVILTGDITHFGPAELGEEILDEISQFDTPVLAVPGNCDPENIHGKIDNSKAINIHGRSIVIKDIGICGFGGSNPTPFSTPLEFEEVQIYDEACKVLDEVKEQNITIFVTHAPPFQTNTDLLPSGMHVGSESLRRLIEEHQPSINICGHIHESRGMDEIGKTQVINPGQIEEGYVCLIHIDDSDFKKPKIKSEIIKIS